MASAPAPREGEFVERLETRRMLADALAPTTPQFIKPTYTQPSTTGTVVVTSPTPAPAPESASALAAPASVGATAGGRAHAITVIWRGVEGATGYRIERDGGSGWVTAGTVGAITRFTDAGLAEQTTYRYRVVALGDAGATSGPSGEVATRTAAFRFFDGTLFSNRPKPLGPGIENLEVGYEHEYFDWRGWLSKSQTEAQARRALTNGKVLAIDIESFHTDIRAFPTSVVDKSIADFNKVIGWIRRAAPGIKLGIINLIPQWPPHNPDDPAQLAAWRNASDYLFQRVAPMDILFTGLYERYDDPMIEWQKFVEPMLREAQRYGKPVYHFVSMQHEWTAQLLSADHFAFMLATTRRMADGAVLWGGAGMQWDGSAAWFQGMQAFQNEAPQPPTSLPTLSIDPLGARLHWTTPAADISQLIIERSSDGVNFARVGAAGHDQQQWWDVDLRGGSVRYYRLSAGNGYGAVGYSNIVSATLARDGRLVNQAESYDQAFREQRDGKLVATGNSDWFRYRDVHFDGSPTQLTVRLGVLPVNDGMRLLVRLDGTAGPIIGDYLMESSSGYYDLVEQTIPISGASGVHDVYFSFTGGTMNGSMDSWQFKPSGVPARPTRLVTKSLAGAVNLTWKDNAGDETGYRIERAAPGQPFTTLTTLGPNTTSYSDTTGAPTTKYTYRVIATSAVGVSEPTNPGVGRPALRNPYQRIEAESVDDYSGVYVTGSGVGGMGGRDWMRFFAVDFGTSGAATFSANLAVPTPEAGQQLLIRLDAPDGPVVGVLTTVETTHVELDRRNAYQRYQAAWNVYKVQSTTLFGATGVHDVYIVGQGNKPMGVGNVDWIEFTPNAGASSSAASSSASAQPPTNEDEFAEEADSVMASLESVR